MLSLQMNTLQSWQEVRKQAFFFFLTQEQSYNYSSTSNAHLFMRWQSVKFVFSSCINKDGTLTVNDNSVSQNEKIYLLLKQVFMGWDFD